MPKFIDLLGRHFGAWEVIAPAPTPRRRSVWLCRCACGAEKPLTGQILLRGSSKSCGCQTSQLLCAAHTGKPKKRRAWCATRQPEYNSWSSMWERCRNPACKAYPYYGGRGVIVCPEWSNFKQFLADMGPRPLGKYFIDRIDPNGDYTPENTRWVTPAQSAKNRRGCQNDTTSSKYKGVSRSPNSNRYTSSICTNGEVVQLGRFWTAEAAALAYDLAAESLHKEYACTNRSLGLLPEGVQAGPGDKFYLLAPKGVEVYNRQKSAPYKSTFQRIIAVTKLNFHLPDTLRAEIDDLRHRTGLTLSEIIRQALRMYLASRKAQDK